MNRKAIIDEFIRYIFVGGTAFFIDILTLYFFKTQVFFGLGYIGIYVSTALGFLAGLIFNYICSLIFVFKDAKEQGKGRNIFSFFLFSLIGMIGLLLTEIGMYAGVNFFNMNYLLTKVIVAAAVLIWNYAARKILIFT
ncbi:MULTISPECIES: GtrA family protein [unclassified Clostridium]|uniref:GtrA family protein n=1 Tax=unclassified Clostridium TaxID=2614128 RepID=UPI00029785E6|nr:MULTISPECIES: GtrA family protein [unclassified Clostridium]EKQ51307.1 MAG: putative membrane protein [Clostridium sp. Maddingley MBC34-26]